MSHKLPKEWHANNQSDGEIIQVKYCIYDNLHLLIESLLTVGDAYIRNICSAYIVTSHAFFHKGRTDPMRFDLKAVHNACTPSQWDRMKRLCTSIHTYSLITIA